MTQPGKFKVVFIVFIKLIMALEINHNCRKFDTFESEVMELAAFSQCPKKDSRSKETPQTYNSAPTGYEIC